jgi:hypothetical protein
MPNPLLDLVAELFRTVFVRPDGMSVRDANQLSRFAVLVRRLAVSDPAFPSMLRRVYGHRGSRQRVVFRFIEAWNKLPMSLRKIVMEQAAACGCKHQIEAVVGEWASIG